MRILGMVFLELRRLVATVDLEFRGCGGSLKEAASAAL